LFAAKKYDAALQKFQFAVQSDPGSAKAHYWLGRALDQRGRRKEALQSLEKAQQLDPALGFTEKKAFTELVQRLQKATGKARPTAPATPTPPTTPEKAVPPPAPPSPPEASTAPAAPAPPGRLYGTIGGSVAGGLVVLWLIRAIFLQVRSKGHLTTHHAASLEFYQQVADGLTRARQSLQARPNPTAAARVEAAELAFFEALDMLAAANQEDTGHLPRVRRARELLERAQEELASVQDQLTEADPNAQARWGCYFCSKPLPDREEGDLLALRKAEESRHVLICRGCSRRYRQKNVPPVRVVRSGGRVRHWATVADYDLFYDYYHDDRHGRHTQPLAELEELFITPAGPTRVFVEGGGRPDYVLRVEELRQLGN
jgi:tetratricopeptide (TPR) repeat protein